MDGLDFLTVAGNFLDAYSRARREDLNFRRQAAREDQLTAAQRQYETGVREGEHAFQAAQAEAARGFQRGESDREYARGATGRALQEQQARLQLGMTQAQFDEWKQTAPGRAHLAELEGRKTEAEINRLNAEAGHYRAMGAGGGGGSKNDKGTPEELAARRREQLITTLIKRFPMQKDPDTGEDVTDWDALMARAEAMADHILGAAKPADPAPVPTGPAPTQRTYFDRDIADPQSKNYRPDFVSAADARVNQQVGDYTRRVGNIPGAGNVNPGLEIATRLAAGISSRPLRKALRERAGIDPVPNPAFNPAAMDTTIFRRK